MRYVAHVPSRNIFVKGGLVLEGIGHIRHPRHGPVLDMPVGGDGRGLVGKPEVSGGVKISVGEGRVLPLQGGGGNQPKQYPCKDRLEEGGAGE